MFKSFVLVLTVIALLSNSTTALATQADTGDTNDVDYYCSPVMVASSSDIERFLFDSRLKCQETTSIVQKLKNSNFCYQEITNFLRKNSKKLSLADLQSELTIREAECKKL